MKTYFVMCDLAGAERPNKAGLARKTVFESMVEFWKGKAVDPS